MPQTAGRPGGIVRDLDVAEEMLRQAVKIAPTYPENHIALARTLYMQDRYDEAAAEIMMAKEHLPEWRIDGSYGEWKKTIKRLSKKIERKRK